MSGRLMMYSVFDSKAEAFLRPFAAETRGLAIRSFSDAVNDAQHEFFKHGEDYTLFEVGVFDVGTGLLEGKLHSLGTALQFRVAVESPVRRVG